MAQVASPPPRVKLISYRYTANTSQGRLVKGTVKARTEVAAERLLVEKDYQPLTIEAIPAGMTLESLMPSLYKVKPRDLIVFSRQLPTLLKSGISLLPSLEILQQQTTTSWGFRKMLNAVTSDIRAGLSFSQSIAKHPDVFSDIYCRTIAVGEHSGSMETVLRQMADYIERQTAMTGLVRKALSYPIMVLSICVGVVIVLMIVVLPKLMDMFTMMKVQLPLPTRMLVAAVNLFSGHTVLLVSGIALLVTVMLFMAKQPRGRRMLDRLVLAAPLVGQPMLLGELARFSRSMSVLITAGMKLQDIMEVLPQSSKNSVIRAALRRVGDGLLLGQGLSEPMSRIRLFPSLLVQMVAVGEESNTLDFTLGVVADFYETTAQERMSAMVGMIGPLSTMLIGIVVGFIALAILMPIYSLTGAFG